ncbi:hypothetical protein DERP_005170 [Dermatophagoides pteronyssinus]|uniref:Nucleolus and neural progenitor protein-like N-terminal domain-containing protein n=1 Tax=Dermatophagoides pteronyssinus TaxID=6956 RepID=A0ABQ8JLV0_DERPT|nr:hypothetical protein DERP_005170 [Dermatophagoides pteronyssinus]
MSVINNNDQSINKESNEKSYKSLYCLINDQSFHAECELLKRMSPKIGIRLRNSEYSRSIEQFCRWIDKLRLKIEHFPNDYNQITVNKLEQFGFCLYKISIISMKVFRLSKIWIELGQLINHFLMIIGLASRICIFIKAMMVYTYDIYNHHLHDDDDDKLKNFLIKWAYRQYRQK